MNAEQFTHRWTPEPNTGCWLWVRGFDKGYGRAWTGARYERAHRLSWKLHNGAIPAGIHVLHRCDTPACVNPDHLFLGTHADNMADCGRKGRQPGPGHKAAGEANGNAKLTSREVSAIRASNLSGLRLAKKYGVTHQNISWIRKGLTWSHV